MITVYFFRHAESMGNVNNHLIGGRSNHFPLSDRGYHQANLLGERLSKENLSFDFVYSSIAVRAKETARIACEKTGFDPVKILFSEDLVELSQGEWEGKNREEYYTPEVRVLLKADPYNFKPPGGESQREVENRMYAWMETTVRGLEPGQNLNLGVFSHGFAIKSLVRKILDFSPNMTFYTIVHNTSITCLQFHKSRWLVERVNDFAHLAGTEIIGHY
ncbi:MAG: histidine phosphatase family protein [Bacteroidia bacterium]|nr:histidine phosphatase family protein [Bacteroidia bacterium]